MSQGLTREIAYDALQNFFINKPFVLFGTGPSIAMDKHFGMENLKKFLCEKIPIETLTGREKTEWDRVVEFLDRDNNLESALNEVKEEKVLKKLIGLTFELLGKLNKKYHWQVLSGEKTWTVASILEQAAKLPSANLVVFDLHGEYKKLSYARHLRIPGPEEPGKTSRDLLYLPYWLFYR